MRKLLLQLDGDRLPSVFDRVVAFDAGADEVMSYGGVAEPDVRDLVHGAIFTRGPADLRNTAIFIGGSDVTLGERMLRAAERAFFGPMRVSLMLDANGSNTTAVAAVAKVARHAGEVRGRRATVTAGTGPVGMRVAGLLARAGAEVVITSRGREHGEEARRAIAERFGAEVRAVVTPGPDHAAAALEGAEILVNAGPAGVMLVPRSAWSGREGLAVAVDLNAVPPLGIEGIEAMDDGVEREGVTCVGALGAGGLKMKIHKACVARLFERNDLVLDAEAIEEVARALQATKGQRAGAAASRGGQEAPAAGAS